MSPWSFCARAVSLSSLGARTTHLQRRKGRKRRNVKFASFVANLARRAFQVERGHFAQSASRTSENGSRKWKETKKQTSVAKNQGGSKLESCALLRLRELAIMRTRHLPATRVSNASPRSKRRRSSPSQLDENGFDRKVVLPVGQDVQFTGVYLCKESSVEFEGATTRNDRLCP